MLRVGIVGWRGMVGSVLVQRMREEKDFDGSHGVVGGWLRWCAERVEK